MSTSKPPSRTTSTSTFDEDVDPTRLGQTSTASAANPTRTSTKTATSSDIFVDIQFPGNREKKSGCWDRTRNKQVSDFVERDIGKKNSNAGLCDAAKTKITSNFKLLQTKKATSARKFSLSAEIKNSSL